MIRLLLLAWAALLLFIGPARAETTTEAALSVVCPGHLDLAPHLDAAARRYLVHPVVLVALMAEESGCRMGVVGSHGEVCAMQIHGVARNGHSRRALRSDPALCIATGARWLSLRTVDCGGGLLMGLAGYNAKECRHGKRYALRVLATVARIWKAIEQRKEWRS